MTRDELQKLLKVTSRAIEILVVWKGLYLGKHPGADDSREIYKVNDAIAELTAVKMGLKSKLKGNGDFTLPEKFLFLTKAYGDTTDPEEKQILYNQLVELTKDNLSEVILEATNDQS